jgi:UDP-glucose 4-epimerase
MRVLITGSSGRLGEQLADSLAPAHTIVGVDRRAGRRTTLVGDIADPDFVAQAAAGAEAILHTASLHAPDVVRASKAAFIQANITGTLNLLNAAVANNVRRFVYTSTTSLYGNALVPTDRAAWVTEDLPPQPRDIYDVTKIAAEQLCRLFAMEHGLPVLALRVARFFPEPPEQMLVYRLYRGVDVRDVCAAHQLALENRSSAFDVFNISARTPFQPQDTVELFSHAEKVISRYYPNAPEIFQRHGWSLPTSIDRVYVTAKAETQLGYQPQHNFAELLAENQ